MVEPRLTPFAKFLLAVLIIGTVGYGLYLNRSRIGNPLSGLTRSPVPRVTPSTAGSREHAAAQKELLIEGSTAMIKLVAEWGKMFEAAHPEVKFVRGWGGTGRGIAQLIGGAVDIAAASRPLKEKEKTLATAKGMHISTTAVAIDAIAVIVNRRNPVTELTVQQLAGIYAGRISNWRQLGGTDLPIIFFGREKTAGLYELFKDMVLGPEAYSPRKKVARTTTEMLRAIIEEGGAVGTATLAQSVRQTKVKILGLSSSPDGLTVYPFLGHDINFRAIRNRSYPLTREMYLMTAGEPSGVTRDFINLALSTRGQDVVRTEGYVPVG